MWFNKTREIQALKGKILELQSALFQSQQFERIADAKLTLWVEKHDNLLTQYKTLQKTFL